jgi:hypothetical protein
MISRLNNKVYSVLNVLTGTFALRQDRKYASYASQPTIFTGRLRPIAADLSTIGQHPVPPDRRGPDLSMPA